MEAELAVDYRGGESELRSVEFKLTCQTLSNKDTSSWRRKFSVPKMISPMTMIVDFLSFRLLFDDGRLISMVEQQRQHYP